MIKPLPEKKRYGFTYTNQNDVKYETEVDVSDDGEGEYLINVTNDNDLISLYRAEAEALVETLQQVLADHPGGR